MLPKALLSQTKSKAKTQHRLKNPVKVHVWAGISKQGATHICIFEGKMMHLFIFAYFEISKHISQLENSHIRTYAYLAEANTVHSI